MAQYPSLPLFTDAYLADTRHLTAAQHGAYLLLLMMAWRSPDCTLPDNDETLARWASMPMRTWLVNKPTVMGFWVPTKDAAGATRWMQRRLTDERNFVNVVRNARVQAGRSSALKRKDRHPTSVPANPQQNLSTHTHTHISKKNLQKKDDTNPQQTPTGSGSFDSGSGEVLRPASRQPITTLLSDDQLNQARSIADGWDIYRLTAIYDAWQKDKPPPDKPGPAFLGWLKNYTKQKPPG